MNRTGRRPAATLRKRPATAFSLLEVMLALVILGGAIVVLGEAGRFALENARVARDLAQAQLLCESKLAEIAAGVEAPEPVQSVFLAEGTDPSQPIWLYSIETETVDRQGLMGVWVTVVQDLPPEKRPVDCTLVRWMIDPEMETLLEESSASSQTSGSTSSSATATP